MTTVQFYVSLFSTISSCPLFSHTSVAPFCMLMSHGLHVYIRGGKSFKKGTKLVVVGGCALCSTLQCDNVFYIILSRSGLLTMNCDLCILLSYMLRMLCQYDSKLVQLSGKFYNFFHKSSLFLPYFNLPICMKLPYFHFIAINMLFIQNNGFQCNI